MEDKYKRKYQRVTEILSDITKCHNGNLVLVGGTALTLFYLKHRLSIDLDFAPLKGSDVKLKQELKGCLTKLGYMTTVGSYGNQFIIQFEDTSIKIEIFEPQVKIKKIEEHVFNRVKVKVASLEDIFEMKIIAYKNRKAARDLFDIYCILKLRNEEFTIIKKLISENGLPDDTKSLKDLMQDDVSIKNFLKVISNATTS
ncbi:MAG: nucleotidyl transferase AbiEii/AbiGii toxin family protein [Candidatus Marsarchaeota archaeon]|jgi:predicted nucleotidyltransferase component of viral defense system|nr:nucleotidyl transferase AbiEii/AbiGii toxin family protein [Candidatus Marsarchaeota archaeon]